MLSVLVICTSNSCRSVIGEALFNHLGKGRVQAYSAGSNPKGIVKSQAIELLEKHGVSTRDLSSKSWHSLNKQQFDIIITVCDKAANEVCPSYFDSALKIHWATTEPSHAQGGNQAVQAALENTYQIFEQRISRMLALPLNDLPVEALANQLRAIS